MSLINCQLKLVCISTYVLVQCFRDNFNVSEELMCHVVGDLQAGVVAKLADDLYCGGNTPGELLKNLNEGPNCIT